jgi:hypothetical protein
VRVWFRQGEMQSQPLAFIYVGYLVDYNLDQATQKISLYSFLFYFYFL